MSTNLIDNLLMGVEEVDLSLEKFKTKLRANLKVKISSSRKEKN